jgi:hypothetical protein
MVRGVLTASLGLTLLAAGAGHSSGSDPVLAPEKADLALAVKLRIPGDETYEKVKDLLDKVKARGATRLSLRASKKGEGPSAEVVSHPRTPSKSVAAVVQELLDRGIRKISVEVKK